MLPHGDLVCNLTLRDLPVSRLLRLLPGLAGKASGILSGVVRASVPLDRLQVPSAWRRSRPESAAAGRVRRDADRRVGGTDHVPRAGDSFGCQRRAGRHPISGSATLLLSGAQPFQADLKGARARHRSIGDFAPCLMVKGVAHGTVETSAVMRGTLTPCSVAGTGKLSTGSVGVAGFQVGELALAWSLADGKLKVSNFLANLYKGKVTGSGEATLGGNSSGAAGGPEHRRRGLERRWPRPSRGCPSE